PVRPVNGIGVKEWKAFTDDMKKSSRALGEAAHRADPAKLQDAARGLYNSCQNCHGAVRKGIGPRRRPDLREDLLSVGHAAGPKAASQHAGNAVKKHELKHLMSVAFDARKNGGLGLGQEGDGIATRIDRLAGGALSSTSLPRQKRDVVLIARV